MHGQKDACESLIQPAAPPVPRWIAPRAARRTGCPGGNCRWPAGAGAGPTLVGALRL